MPTTPYTSDEDVYLSDPPSDLEFHTRDDEDYEYHPANSGWSTPAVSLQLESTLGNGEEVGVVLKVSESPDVPVPPALSNGHHAAAVSGIAGVDGDSEASPIDVGAILSQAAAAANAAAANAAAAEVEQGARAPSTFAAPKGLGLGGGLKPLPPRPAAGLVEGSALAAPEEKPRPRGLGLGLGLPAKAASGHKEAPVAGSSETEEEREEEAAGGQGAVPAESAEEAAEASVSLGVSNGATAPVEKSGSNGPVPEQATTAAPTSGSTILSDERSSVAAALPQRQPNGSAAPKPTNFPSRSIAEIDSAMAAAREAEAKALASAAADPKLRKLRADVQALRITMLRAARHLGISPGASVVQQALYRLNMAERLQLPRMAAANVDDAAEEAAARSDEDGEPLEFEAAVLVIGMRGTGKTATINSLLATTGAAAGGASAGLTPVEQVPYTPTAGVCVTRANVCGLRLTFIDTPGLEGGTASTGRNARTVRSIRRAWDRYRPDVVLYVDRLDACRRDAGELHALRALTDSLGPEAWYSAMVCVTHALARPPDGAAGAPLSAETYAQSRQQQLLQVVRAVAGDNRMMNPVVSIENGAACARNGEGEPVLPNGVAWRRQLLALVATTRVLNQGSRLLKPEKAAALRARGGAGNPFGRSMKVPPMGWLLAKLVEFRSPRKFSEEEREFKREDELKGMTAENRTRELRRRRAYIRQKADEARGEESTVPVLAPEPALGPSFDAEVNGYRYRVLENPRAMLTRPVVGDAGVDHEDGIDSVQVEKATVLRRRNEYLGGLPALSWVQLTKDKNGLTFQGETDLAAYPKSYWALASSVNAQSVQNDILYTARLDSRLRGKTSRQKFAVGLLASKLGENMSLPIKPGNIAFGIKLDERLRINEALKIRAAVGRLLVKMGTVYEPGTSLAADVKLTGDRDSRLLAGLTAQWQGRDKRAARQSLVVGGNVSGEYRLPRLDGSFFKSDTLLSANCQYTSRGQGTVVVRLSSHDLPQLALLMVVPVLKAAWDKALAPGPAQMPVEEY